jgi:uncharacterized protein YdeI (YjbR/CyaY-like superfamily)
VKIGILGAINEYVMTDSEKVAAYIQKHPQWSEQLGQLRSVFQETELMEEVKWGSPTYTLNGKLVAGMAAFKNHYALWFHQGIFLKDRCQKLVNAQETTRGLRQWRFTVDDPIPKEIVLDYFQEAIENCLAGKEIKIQRKEGVSIPPFLKTAFGANPQFKASFQKLTPGKQREYTQYIADAKRIETKQSRLEKIIPMVIEGKGLHDKYKNC